MEELPQLKINQGEEMAWDALLTLEPDVVCKNALVDFDTDTSTYKVRSFGLEFSVNLPKHEISCPEPRGEIFLGTFRDFFRLALLWYLASAKEIDPTGKLLKPGDVKGGHIYVHGTHKLPLGDLAEEYRSDAREFIEKGRGFGAEKLEGIGDAAIRLYPLPRVPVTMVLRAEDQEEGFPSEVRVFFDSTLDFQVAPDIGWSLAMVSCLAMLGES